MSESIRDRGTIVTAAGTGINLALGVLYTWSIFKAEIKASIQRGGPEAFAWSATDLNDPYALCCLVFAFVMIAAGKIQDRIGPRIAAAIGALLVGAGFLLVADSTSYVVWLLGFGGLVGAGIAFGYSSATPPALKWFPPHLTGRIAGVVVSGFGLASLYIAPLAKHLLGGWGLGPTMQFFGVAFFIVVGLLSLALVNPPAGFVPRGFVDRRAGAPGAPAVPFKEASLQPRDILRTREFWLLWVIYFIGAGAGLMVIGNIAGMAQQALGERAFLAVAILAIGNAGGRIAAGALSDRIGRRRTLVLVLSLQALLMVCAVPVVGGGASALLVLLLATAIGFNYGANLAIFPAITKGLWGIAHFGVNYGLVFTAWGVGGFVLAKSSQILQARSGSFATSCTAAALLLAAGALLATRVHERRKAESPPPVAPVWPPAPGAYCRLR